MTDATNATTPTPAEAPSEGAKPVTRRRFLRSALRLGALGLVGGVYTMGIEPGWIEFSQVEVAMPRLHPAFDGYRIVQFSDIHFDSWMTEARLGGIVAAINQLKADAIVITGDFVSIDSGPVAPALVRSLSHLSAPDGVFAIPGNHDHWHGLPALLKAIRGAGVRDLRNASATITRGDATLHLAGVDDPWVGTPKLKDVTDALPADGAAIMLAHAPDFADEVAPLGRYDLQLSGHSHGGQVRLLGWAPVLPPFGKRYPSGRYDVNGMTLYTNRGVGTIPAARVLRVRFMCWPEITTFTLRVRAPRP